MVTIWGWCLVFVLAGQQPIVQFDYKTEADCNTSRIAVNEQHADATESPGACRSRSLKRPSRAKSKKRHTARRQ